MIKTLSFDSGIATFYRLENIAAKGDAPKKGLVEYGSFFFGYADYGVSIDRDTKAQSVGHRISELINIELNRDIDERFVCKIDGRTFQVYRAQHMKDDAGNLFTQVSLERRSDDYD